MYLICELKGDYQNISIECHCIPLLLKLTTFKDLAEIKPQSNTELGAP